MGSKRLSSIEKHIIKKSYESGESISMTARKINRSPDCVYDHYVKLGHKRHRKPLYDDVKMVNYYPETKLGKAIIEKAKARGVGLKSVAKHLRVSYSTVKDIVYSTRVNPSCLTMYKFLLWLDDLPNAHVYLEDMDKVVGDFKILEKRELERV